MNSYFPQWTSLSFRYNALQNHYITDKAAWKMDEIKVIHYVKFKPWMSLKGGLTEEQQKMFDFLKELQAPWWKYHAMLLEEEAKIS